MIAFRGLLQSWGLAGITILQILALLPPLAVVVFERGSGQLELLAFSIGTVVVWDLIFSAVRKRRVGFHGVTVALIVVVFLPADLPLWQLVLTLSLGLVLGEHVFGGRGFGFLSSAAVCLSLLLFSFPHVQLEQVSQSVALATLPGALLLLVFGLISWRVVIGTVAGLVGLLLLLNYELQAVSIGAVLVFGLVFLVSDPTSAASTNPGRWIYGLLASFLILLFSGASAAVTSEGVVFAALMASVFAPLIDHLVVLAHAERKRRRLV